MLAAAFEGGIYMYLDFEELLALMFVMVFPMCLISYGLIALVKNMVARYKEQMTTESARPNITIKKDILDAVKLLFGAQVLCLLFYITPAINENIKIVLSLAITLGAFVVTFFIKEKGGYNSLSRGLIFIGQEFFGITMLLMMVNKGMGYSVTVIFALWSLFNFYIMKEFGKLENKMFFAITLIGLIISLLTNYLSDISAVLAVIFIAVILLVTHIFVKKETMGVAIGSNILFVLMFIASMVAVSDTWETPFVMFTVTIVFVVALALAKAVEGRLNLRALLLYIPLVVILLLVGNVEDVMMVIPLFNIVVAALIASPKSIGKKILALMFLLYLSESVSRLSDLDELVSMLIYVCSVIYTFAAVCTQNKKVEITEGGDDNE